MKQFKLDTGKADPEVQEMLDLIQEVCDEDVTPPPADPAVDSLVSRVFCRIRDRDQAREAKE